MFANSRVLLAAPSNFIAANRRLTNNVLSRKPTTTESVRRRSSEAVDEKMNKVLVSPFQKRILVWSNKYPNVDQVPDKVSYEKMKKAKEWFRIRLNIGMCIATLIGCGTMIYAGKREHSWGWSVSRENFEWHKQVHDEKHAHDHEKTSKHAS